MRPGIEAIQAAARVLASARIGATRAEAALAKTTEAVALLADRSAALTAERSAIGEKARAGGDTAALSLRLLVVDADLVDLAALAEAAQADCTAALAVAIEARQAVAAAEWSLSEAEADEYEARLLIHSATLDALLLETIGELITLGARKGSRPIWAPSPALADAINRAHLNRGSVRQ
jgi:hypothetical protein